MSVCPYVVVYENVHKVVVYPRNIPSRVPIFKIQHVLGHNSVV